MTRKIIWAVLIVLIVLFTYIRKNYITQVVFVGSYINTNFNYTPSVSEIPYSKDTITFHDDGTFYSSYYGKGTYKLIYSLKGTTLSLDYDYEFGNASFETNIKRELLGNINIILNQEMNYYYSKVDK